MSEEHNDTDAPQRENEATEQQQQGLPTVHRSLSRQRVLGRPMVPQDVGESGTVSRDETDGVDISSLPRGRAGGSGDRVFDLKLGAFEDEGSVSTDPAFATNMLLSKILTRLEGQDAKFEEQTLKFEEQRLRFDEQIRKLDDHRTQLAHLGKIDHMNRTSKEFVKTTDEKFAATNVLVTERTGRIGEALDQFEMATDFRFENLERDMSERDDRLRIVERRLGLATPPPRPKQESETSGSKRYSTREKEKRAQGGLDFHPHLVAGPSHQQSAPVPVHDEQDQSDTRCLSMSQTSPRPSTFQPKKLEMPIPVIPNEFKVPTPRLQELRVTPSPRQQELEPAPVGQAQETDSSANFRPYYCS